MRPTARPHSQSHLSSWLFLLLHLGWCMRTQCPPRQAIHSQQVSPRRQPAPKPKRKQVKMACTNCASACKRCDEARPCERCVKYGLAETCVDGVRKERKKGIKRGPYKRKNRNGSGEPSNGKWLHTDVPLVPPDD
ncbi:hypothetical protein NUW54_g14545 [Trametes sanguinea]|uniref:Uncharacterized protein n=1 Tax=Trametes sanguinea TaxID=158606 RepID=A0ACC1MDP1_9APHY|nr:hypothetical protein NUW54_g14545 [Trametes sanguinea]